jgi:YesN/AraC family two-component response regulator
MVAPYALTFTSIPYVGLAYAVMLNAYTGVNLANNIWFLYQELASKNMILESTEAYQELYQRISDLTGVEWFSEQATEYEISLEVIKQEMQEQLTYLNQEKVEIIAESEDFLGGEI